MVKMMLAVISCFFLLSCQTTFTPENDPVEKLRDGQYDAAEKAFSDAFDAAGRNKLLHHLELGMVQHLQGNYLRSNMHFDTAETISEDFYTTRLTESTAELFTGPTFASYKGYIFENTFINYYKALNYLALAQQTEQPDPDQLDAALVEIRRLSNRLDRLTNITGGYKKPEKTDKQSSLTADILDIFENAMGFIDETALQYKDDAFAHYLSGLLYEISGDMDGARIEYVKAAETFEYGFAAQYKLDTTSINQVWFDAIKIMKKDGGYENEWPELAAQKLSTPQLAALEEISDKQSELVVIQHIGTAPKRKQLNMRLTADIYSKSLVLAPILTGTAKEQKDQWNWFKMLYSDRDIIDILQNYAVGDLEAVIKGAFTKRIPLGPLWKSAEDIGLINALQYGARIAVPYYPSPNHKFVKTELYINGKLESELLQANSISRIALQEQLRTANIQIQVALTRELVKSVLANQLIEQSGLGNLGRIGFGALNAITASADTRSWLSLPAGVKFARIPVAAGNNTIELKTYMENGVIIEQSKTISVKQDRPALWQTRTFSRPPNLTLTPIQTATQ